MSRQVQIGQVLTVIAALLGAGGGFFLGLRFGEASSDTIAPVVIGAYTGLIVGPALLVWVSLRAARQANAGKTAAYLLIGWAVMASGTLYALAQLSVTHSIPGMIVLLGAVSLAARMWAIRAPRLSTHAAQSTYAPPVE
jgi:hypothetical protein